MSAEGRSKRSETVQAWLVVASCAIFLLIGSSSLNMLTPILALMLEDLGETTNFGSSLYFWDTIVSAVLVIPLGFIINRFGYRKIGFVGYAVLLIAFAWGAMPFAHDRVQLTIIRCLQGVGYIVPPILSVAITAQWFAPEKRGVPIAVVTSMTFLAKVTMLQMSKITIPLAGWHGQFMGCFILTCIGFVFYCLFCKPRQGSEYEVETTKFDKEPLIEVLKNKRIWLVIVLMCAFTVGQRGFTPFSNMIWVDNCGIDNNHASDIDSIFFFMAIPSGLLFGYILSRFQNNRGKIIAACLTVYFIGMAGAYWINQAWMAWAFAFGIGVLGGVPQFCQICLPMFSRTPAVLAMALAVYDLVGKYLTGSVAPYAVSLIQTATGAWQLCSIPMAVIGALAIVCVWRLGLDMDCQSAGEDDQSL